MIPLAMASGELQKLYEGDHLELEVLQGNVVSDRMVRS